MGMGGMVTDMAGITITIHMEMVMATATVVKKVTAFYKKLATFSGSEKNSVFQQLAVYLRQTSSVAIFVSIN